MLALDDPRWEELRAKRTSHPREFLPLLTRLRDDPAAINGTLDELAKHLWQQFDVDETTVAAFPHLVAAIARLAPAQRAWALEHIGLVAALVSECADLSPPEDVRRAYDQALVDCLPLALEALACGPPEEELIWIFAAIAALQGRSEVCNALLGLSRQLAVCPECGEEIDLKDLCRHW